jgi:aquaporin Z
MIGIPVANLSVNPARSKTGDFCGWWALERLWLFWVAPVLGGNLGGGAYRTLVEE